LAFRAIVSKILTSGNTSVPKNKLLGFDDVLSLEIKEITDIYKKHVSSSQTVALSMLGSGRDLFVSAEGNQLATKAGKQVLDFTGGFGVLNHGHNHPRIMAAREQYAKKKIPEVHKNYLSPFIAGLSKNIAALLPADLNISYTPNSGAEAVEGAVKMAYKFHNGKRQYILSSDIAFHGKLLGAGGLTASREVEFSFPTIPNIQHFRFDDAGSLENVVERLRTGDGSSDIYAVLVEPFSASNLTASSEGFLRAARKICDNEGIVLIFDEIYSGWGKTGHLFNFMQWDGLVPDILTASKSFGGGKSSISLYVARDKIFRAAYDRLDDFMLHSTTYNGFGEEAATALEAVNIIVEDDYPAMARSIGLSIESRLKELKDKYPDDIQSFRGQGALWGLYFHENIVLLDTLKKALPSGLHHDELFLSKLITSAVVARLYEKHNILTGVAVNDKAALWIGPSIVTSEEELNTFFTSLNLVLENGLNCCLLKFITNRFRVLFD
jgi:putrescine aminotransferase